MRFQSAMVALVASRSCVYSSKVANQTFIQSWYQKGMDDDMMGFQARLNDMEMYVSDVDSRTIIDPDALQTLRNYRRFQQLKTLALWLQREPRFGKYCYYGCYCLDWIHRLEDPENVPAGKGTPVDSVDDACKVQTDCYWCAMNELKRACSPDAKYAYELTYDETDPTNIDYRDVVCQDPWNYETGGDEKSHCKRAICECDRGLAHRLSMAQDDWSPEFHKNQGGFDKSTCVGSVGPKKNECCGDYEEFGLRFPYSSGNSKACCGRKTYNTMSQECCDETTSHVTHNGDCML